MVWLIGFFTLFGINFSFWGAVGVARLVSNAVLGRKKIPKDSKYFSFLSVTPSRPESCDAIVTLGFSSPRIYQALYHDFRAMFFSARTLNLSSSVLSEPVGDVDIINDAHEPLAVLGYAAYRHYLNTQIGEFGQAFERDAQGMKEKIREIIYASLPEEEATAVLGGLATVIYDRLSRGEPLSKAMKLFTQELLDHYRAQVHEVAAELMDRTDKAEALIQYFFNLSKEYNRLDDSALLLSQQAKSIVNFLGPAHSVAIVIGSEQDYDAFAAAAALIHLLRLMKKEVVLVLPQKFFLVPRIFLRPLLKDIPMPRVRAITDSYFSYTTLREMYNDGKRINPYSITRSEVAAIIPAHNEEDSISKTLVALKKNLPAANIYVGSDASTDKTVEIVKSFGCNVLEIYPNRGKAGVLAHLLEHYKLCENYKAIIIVDADSEVGENFLTRALRFFDDPQIVAVANHAESKWYRHWPPRPALFFSAYRVRFYRILQAISRYGQTTKYLNVSTIIPGYSSIYRTSVLPQIHINAPGLVIEDYNMTFEVRHKKLGKVGYDPGAKSFTQDPVNLKDYMKQVKRWNLGFWQTVRRHGIWPSLFWLSTGIFLFEMIVYGIFFLLTPFFVLWFAYNLFGPIPVPSLAFGHFGQMTLLDLLIGVFFMDYILTIIVAIYEKKPILLIYGLGFVVLRYIDTFMFLYTLPLAFIVKSSGKWVSPKRHSEESIKAQ